MLIAVVLAKTVLGSGIIDLAIYIFIGTIAYMVCLFLLRDELFISAFGRMIGFIKGRTNR